MKVVKFEAIRWTIELAEQREIQAIREQTAERLRGFEDDPEAIMLLESANINVANIRCQRRLASLRAVIWRENLTPGPVNRLPAEMLSEIFRYYVESNMCPWTLVKVCKRWQETALRTPHLWGNIVFTNDDALINNADCWIVDGRRQFSRDNQQLCLNLSQVKAALTRSGVLPLEVAIQHFDDQLPNSDIESVIALLVKDPTSRRIRSLEIISSNLRGTSIVPGQFPLLKVIFWYGPPLPWMIELFKMVSESANHLEVAKFLSELPEQLVDLPFWSRLQEVGFMNHDPDWKVRQLNKVAHKLGSLDRYFEGPCYWPDVHTPVFCWPKIRSMSLQCLPDNLVNANFPRLEWLEIDETEIGRGGDNPPPLSFPSLAKLRLITTGKVDWLSSASLPCLTKLDINCSWTQDSEDCSTIFQGLSLPTIQKLKMGCRWNDGAVVAALESVPNVIHLKLLGTIRPYNCRVSVINRLRDRRLPLICSRLASLRLGDDTWPVYILRENIVPVIKQLVRTRRRIKTPLQELAVRWGDEVSRPNNRIENFA
jgi:hypothetical protein